MQKNKKSLTPSKLGYRMPAEWEEHESTWIAWPHNKDTWKNIDAIEKTYIEIIKALHSAEKVNVLVNDAKEELHVKKKLS